MDKNAANRIVVLVSRVQDRYPKKRKPYQQGNDFDQIGIKIHCVNGLYIVKIGTLCQKLL